ncbi:hypothetical protein D2E30_04175 [Mycobacteroides abscessus]|uniref:Uncharacterized protein n=1 Tax=Mycobacteroides abscessus TaxID=36809 RepID=A0ABD7HHV5_9MYCO|nr:hypothetical protein BAB76_22810 [Mycobacteroides abscessus]OLT74393.1 hypothetical protein BKG55_05985 [Mycobacteroides abscessus ATCC 19977]ANO21046.1 hypothetical protein BAB78_22790 [Mycobacteroides abscessus]OTQ92042.1 hypothetical protein B9M85_22930 [Mycobacteroides abscessus]OTR25269.1 hypothetical protein B9M79_23245 [Mycobacteroides abscessus]
MSCASCGELVSSATTSVTPCISMMNPATMSKRLSRNAVYTTRNADTTAAAIRACSSEAPSRRMP